MSTMRRYRGMWILLLSVAAGMALTAFLYQRLVEGLREAGQAQAGHDQQSVILALQDIPPGTTLTDDHIKRVWQPARFVPEDALRKKEEAQGRVARAHIFPGDPIREARLAPDGSGKGLEAIVPPGMRAIQIDMPPERAVSGLIAPGHMVDLIASCRDKGRPHVVPLLQDVRVLAVKGRYNDEKRKKNSRRHKPTLTLAVTPQDALSVRTSSSQCTLSVALRSEAEPAAHTSLGDDSLAP